MNLLLKSRSVNIVKLLFNLTYFKYYFLYILYRKGTDISENMIEYAKKRYAIKNTLEFEVLDIQTKNLPTEYIAEFDCILSFHTLHWCTDIR